MAYFPNGVSGVVLDEQCMDCIHEDELAMCPVYYVQCTFNYDQCGTGQEKLKEAMSILIDDDGICKVREAFLKPRNPNDPVPCMDGMKEWAKKHGVRTF